MLVLVTWYSVVANTGNGFDVQYSRISSEKMQLDFIIGDYSLENVEKGENTFTKINYDGKVVTNDKGFAELPYVSKAVQLEDQRNVILEVNYSEYEDISLDYPLLPSRGILTRSQNISTIPYKISQESIKDEWYPEKLAYSVDPFIIRNVRGTSVVIQPFQYNSEKNILRVFKNIKVDLVYSDEKPLNPLNRTTNAVEPEMNSIYRSLFINYNEKKALRLADDGEMLIIYTDQNGGSAALEPYIKWKREKGFTVNTLQVPNGTDLDATETVKNAYDANPNILYVQLVGDWANLKSRFEYYSVTSSDGCEDPVLGHVSGRDEYQDVIIGRFSVQSEEQLLTQINKAINYEKNPESDGTWYKKGLVNASNEGDGMGDDGESDELHNEIIKNNKLLSSTYNEVNTCYQSAGDNGTDITGFINSGLSAVNYTGHGYYQSWSNPSFNNTGVSNLTNGSKLPFVISVACLVGHLSYSSDCFAEAWLKNENGGAVVGWFSTISQPWLPPMRGQDYFYDILIGGYDYLRNPGSGTTTTEQRTTFGALTVNAAHLTLAEAPTDVSTLATIETWTVFGDASLQLRTDTPKPIVCTNSTLLAENYTTTILSSSEPVEGARVTLYQDGINFTGLTDENGNVNIEHTFTEGEVTITVSGFNLETDQFITPVIVLDGPYVKINNYTISTSTFGGSAFCQFELKNIGIENSSDVNLSISTESQYISFIDQEEYFGSISTGDSVSISDCINFQIDSNTPDQEKIEFISQITDNFTKRSYNSKFYLLVNSPDLNISHSIDGEMIDPGDSKDISFRIMNSGNADLDNVLINLTQDTGFPVVITDPGYSYLISQGEFVDVTVNCSFDTSIPLSSFLDFTLKISDDNGFLIEYPLTVIAGLTESFETGDFTNNDWQMTGSSWIIDDNEVYSGNYSSRSGSITDNQTSTMKLQYEFGDNGNISFYRKISSEPNYDFLYFYIDGIERSKWSGSIGWYKFDYDVEPGIHDLSWSYKKDAGISGYSDCAWIDNILISGIYSGIENLSENTPNTTKLYKNYPNPFNPTTDIKFFLEKGSNVKLSVYNSRGQIVNELINQYLNKGMHLMKYNAGNLNSGVYYYLLETDNNKLSEKMLLIK